MIEFPARLSLAQTPTPLQPLRRLQQKTGGPLIWLKRDDMTGSTLTGNKVRKLEFILAKAQEEGYEAVITCGGIHSNHCRATAIAAAQLDLQCHLILRGLPEEGKPLEGNRLLDEISGASISYHTVKDYVSSLDALFEDRVAEYASQNIKALAIPVGGSNGVGIWGYIAASQELAQNFSYHQINPSAIVCASGSGGTQAGLVVGSALFAPDIDVYGINVCDDEAWFVNKINADIAEWCGLYPEQASELSSITLGVNVIDGYVGAGYGKADSDIFATIKLLASLEGVVFDPVYTGKAFDGLLKEIKKGRFQDASDIVFVHTGGVFGLFPYAQSF